MAPMGNHIVHYGNWSSASTYTVDNTTWRYGNTSDTVYVSQPQVSVTYAPLPSVPEDEADADMRWLKRRVGEIEEFSRLAA